MNGARVTAECKYSASITLRKTLPHAAVWIVISYSDRRPPPDAHHRHLMQSSADAPDQWLFHTAALTQTPSTCSLQQELYDRARGIEFLFRLGSSLVLWVSSLSPEICAHDLHSPTSAMCTAATWFHRFYMRYSMEDFHRQVCYFKP